MFLVDLVLTNIDGNINDTSLLDASIECALTFLDWIHHIFVITHLPIGKHFGNKVTVVLEDNRNEQVIETRLHMIQGLNAHFLYAKAGMFVGRKMQLCDFFDSRWLPRVGCCEKKTQHKYLHRKKNDPFKDNNTLDFLFQISTQTRDYHWIQQITPLKRSFFIQAEQHPEINAKFMELASGSCKSTLDPIDVLLYWQYDRGQVIRWRYKDAIIHLDDATDLEECFQKIIMKQLDFYGFRDHRTQWAHTWKLKYYLSHRLPHNTGTEQWIQDKTEFEKIFLPRRH
jgi:hypothetical protein